MEETLNGSTTESTSVANTEAENGENPFADDGNPIAGGGGGLGDPLTPDEGYEYDFGEDSDLSMRTPFDQLLEFEEFDNVGDIFGDLDPSDNPFAGGTPSDEAQLSTVDDNASEGNPNTDENTDRNDVEGDSMMNADFSGIDTGADNTDNGNGNNFIGDSEGESGSNNQAEGNGNWFYGNDNQVNGNGNWNLSGDNDTPFDSTFEGEDNPLTGGNPLDLGEEDGMSSDALGGNNPAFAGGSTTPTPVGGGEILDTADPTGNQNTVNGNGNWNFGSDNNTSGNGNWNFGDGNEVSEGNGNWNLGDDNEVSGNGNRPSGNDNSISGNGNRVTGDGNSINGNRLNLEEDNLDVVGNGDRYFQTDADGNVTLVSDESASDPNFDGVAGASEDEGIVSEEGELDMTTIGNFGGFGSENSSSAGSFNANSDGDSLFGGGSSFDGGASSGGSSFGGGASDGGSPFGGGGASDGGNPFGGGASDGDSSFGGGASSENSGVSEMNASQSGADSESTSDASYEYDFSAFENSPQDDGGNPFGGGASDGGASSGGSTFGGGADGGQMSSDDTNELLRASPFGVLLDIPGVDGVEDIFGNLDGAGGSSLFGDGGAGSDGDTDGFGGGAGGGNPFANFNPLEDGNPFVQGDEPDTAFGGGDASGGGNNPFGDSDSASDDVAGGSSNFPETGEIAISEPGSYVIGDEEGNWYASEDDVVSDDDTSLSNSEIPDVDGAESEGNPFGGNPFELDPAEDFPDSEDMTAEDISEEVAEGEDMTAEDMTVEDMSIEEVAESEDMTAEDMTAEDSSPFGDDPIEFEHDYNWDFGFEDSDSGDGSVPELEDGTSNLIDETDLENPFDETSVFDPENSGIDLPNGATINPFNEDGEFDLSIATPIMNEDGLMVGELDISFPEYVEDYFSSVFNLDEIQEFNSNDESVISDIQDDFGSLFGVDAPVLSEDNVLQLSGGFEIDLSGIMSDSGDLGDSAI